MMRSKYPKFKQGQIEDVFADLSNKEKTELKDYVNYRQARGITTQNPLKESRRHIIQLRYILEKPVSQITLKDLRSYLAILSETNNLKPHTKNDIKINVKNFLKWKFKDWSDRFANLEDIRLVTNYRNEEKINSQTILKKEDIEKFMKNETKIYWKAFFITQYEGGLRTKETRLIKWDDIKLNIDGDISEINIFATKTQKARPMFVKEATHYLKLLKQHQENKEEKGVFVFHSKSDINKPIDKNSVSRWMRDLSKKTGIKCWNYLLRHSRATELYTLADENKIAEANVVRFMGHSKSMKDTYLHYDKNKIKNMLKDQVYKLEELPPEKKAEFEKKMKEQDEKIEMLMKFARGEGWFDPSTNTLENREGKKIKMTKK